MQPSDIKTGARIKAKDGYIGTIEQILVQQATNKPMYLVVSADDSQERLLLPIELASSVASNNEVMLSTSVEETYAQMACSLNTSHHSRTTTQTTTAQAQPVSTSRARSDELVIPLAEERLKVGTRQVEIGEILIHKTVERFEDVQQVPLTREELKFERVAINRPFSGDNTLIQPRHEGDWYVIPIVEEVLTVQKQLVVTEEIRIHKTQVVEEREIREILRRERVEVEQHIFNTEPKPI